MLLPLKIQLQLPVLRAVKIAGLLALAIFNASCRRDGIQPWSLLSSSTGVSLYQVQLDPTNQAYVQLFDLSQVKLDQQMGAIAKPGKGKGQYYGDPSAGTAGPSDSPYFTLESPSDALKDYEQRTGQPAIAMVNASFFEDYEASSRLSFPIKIPGQLVTGGSSPYGPIDNPAEPQYKSIQLKVLVWNSEEAAILAYDPASGAPLTESAWPHAMVSYEYRDHPAYRLAGDPSNRYHVLSTFDRDGLPGDEMLAIATSDRATLEATATLLRESEWNIGGPFMTIDGGTSTYLYQQEAGVLLQPKAVGPQETALLPHYLVFRLKD